MRSLHAFLLAGIFIATVFIIFSSAVNESPKDEALLFLDAVKQGNIDAALKEFGDNTCHCAPKGGYVSYLKYESNEDPNLAFLLGQPFQPGEVTSKQMPYNQQHFVLPWDKPEDVAVFIPITFPQGKGPFFLPIDTAYGKVIEEKQFDAFLKNPEQDWWKAFTLRLRPTLQEGLVQPLTKWGDDAAGKEKFNEEQEIRKLVKENALPPYVLDYMHPRDPAGIKTSGETVTPAANFENKLPRVKSILLGLKVVRRGAIKPWKVRRVAFDSPVLEMPDGKEVALKWPGPSQFQIKKLDQPEPPEPAASKKDI